MTRVAELQPDDQMWSPAGRWETVTSTEYLDGRGLIAVHTNKTVDGYGWILTCTTDLPVMSAVELRHQRSVAVEATPGGDLIAVLSDPAYNAWHWDDGSVTLAQASHKRGEGWTIADHLGTGNVQTTTYANKAEARSAIVRAAKAHAKGLGVRYRGRVGAA